MILDGIISSSWQPFGNESPFVSHPTVNLNILLVRLNNSLILLISPSLFPDVRIQVIMPPLTALLTDSAW